MELRDPGTWPVSGRCQLRSCRKPSDLFKLHLQQYLPGSRRFNEETVALGPEE